MGRTYILRKRVSTLDDLADGVLASLPYTGKKIWLDPANGADTNSGLQPDEAVKTLPVAYGLLTANQNDVLMYMAGASSISLSAKLTWAKSYTHMVGVAAPTMVGQRARIFQAAGDLNLAPLIDVTASGCIFKNLYIFQGTDDAQSKINVQVTGSRNYFENVHFAGGGHATGAVDGGTNLYLNGAAENTFVDCTLGVDTAVQATGWSALLLDNYARRNVFRGCNFVMYAGATTCYMVEVADDTGIDRYNLFQQCMFLNTCRTYTLGTAFNLPGSMDGTTNFLILDQCSGVGMTDWDSNNHGLVYLTTGTMTAGGNSGLMQVSNST